MFIAWDGFRVTADCENTDPDVAVREAYDHVAKKGETPEECRKIANGPKYEALW